MSQPGTLERLLAGQAFIDLSSWRKLAVSGSDAFAWLNDLISADLTGLARGESRRSLLLSPTGRMRADFTVTPYRDGFLLLQDFVHPHAIERLLGRYVLSSDVVLDDVTDEVGLLAFPDRFEQPPQVDDAVLATPSCLGSGTDMLIPMEQREEVAAMLANVLLKANTNDVEVWRVFRGFPRFGVDVGEDDLPQEGALTDAVSFEKGCYVGQEAVAKVRNLGHPRRVLVRVEASGPLTAGEPVCVDGTEVGTVTSAVETPKGTRGLAKVRWAARDGRFATPGGVGVAPVA